MLSCRHCVRIVLILSLMHKCFYCISPIQSKFSQLSLIVTGTCASATKIILHFQLFIPIYLKSVDLSTLGGVQLFLDVHL